MFIKCLAKAILLLEIISLYISNTVCFVGHWCTALTTPTEALLYSLTLTCLRKLSSVRHLSEAIYLCGPYSLPVFCFRALGTPHILTLTALIFTRVLSVMVFSVLLNAEGCWQWEGRCVLPSLYLSERIHTSTHTQTCQRGRFESMVLHGEDCNGVYFDTSAVLLNWVTLTFLSLQHRQCNLQDLVIFRFIYLFISKLVKQHGV